MVVFYKIENNIILKVYFGVQKVVLRAFFVLK